MYLDWVNNQANCSIASEKLNKIWISLVFIFEISPEMNKEITMQLQKEIKLSCDAMLGAMNLVLDQLGFSWPLTH